MSDAKFKIGQVVALDRGAGDGHIQGNEFTVTRLMPLESGFRSYRVRGNDGQERAFQESQLRPGSGSPATISPIGAKAATKAAEAK
jgi:uncharacterized protein YodC (DUF2158 family)